MKLTPHFSLEEFTYSSTALARGIDNSLNPQNTAHVKIISSLTTLSKEVLEPLREHVQEPVIISSGYRCPKLNKLVGGSPTSQHMKGEACDIYLEDQKKLREWFKWLMDNTDFDQLILERTTPKSTHWWLHVSCKPAPSLNRHQVIEGLVKNR